MIPANLWGGGFVETSMNTKMETFEDCRKAVGDLNSLLYTEDNPYPLEICDTCTGMWVVMMGNWCLFSSENDSLKEIEDEDGVVIGYQTYDERLRKEIGRIVGSLSRAVLLAGIPVRGIALKEDW